MSVSDRRLEETPIAVLDFETTGLSPKTGARVIEVGVVRVEAEDRQAPVVILNTLVDPQGPVYATRIHGITDEDVFGAPLFAELAGDLGAALEDAVIVAFNASFDIAFLEGELHRIPKGKAAWVPPHLCLMYLRPLLGLGCRCSLSEACQAYGVNEPAHRAVDDAVAAAQLWLVYRKHAVEQGARTFGDLKADRYKFAKSFDSRLFDLAIVDQLGPRPCPTAFKPRVAEKPRVVSEPVDAVAIRRRRYWHDLVSAFADGMITDQEVTQLRLQQMLLDLPDAEVRAVHARLFGELLKLATEDEAVSIGEATSLSELLLALRQLGWAPGDQVT
jgi:DNA polymerase III epsilon subunit-like protein